MNQLDNYSFSIEVNSLTPKDKAPKSVKDKMPEWALFFKAVASNWNLNRNGYIIRAKAWITWANGKRDLTAINDYLQNWKILFQHNSEKPIGKPLSLKVVWNDLILTGWVLDDTHSNGDIGRGLVTSISTWHITNSREFENVDTWEIQSEDEFFEDENASPWEKLWSGLWVMAVTSAEIIENSLVTIPSNRESHIINNSKYLINKLWVSQDEFDNLLSKNKSMNKKEIDEMKSLNFPKVNDTEEVEKEEVKTEEVVEEKTTTEEKTEEKVNTEEKTEENKVKSVKTNTIVLTDEVKSFLKNTISDLKTELQNDFDLKINQLREDKRNDLATVVTNAVKGDDVDVDESELKGTLR